MKQICILLFLVISVVANAQRVERDNNNESNSLKGMPFKERIVTGGGFGLSFGTNQDFLSLSPIIGYRVFPKLNAGLSLTLRYTNYKLFNPPVKEIDYGVSPFVQLYVYENFFLWGEYEMLNYRIPSESIRQTINSALAGGGFVQPIGRRVNLYVMALYNFNYTKSLNPYTPYPSPLVIRAGFGMGGLSF